MQMYFDIFCMGSRSICRLPGFNFKVLLVCAQFRSSFLCIYSFGLYIRLFIFCAKWKFCNPSVTQKFRSLFFSIYFTILFHEDCLSTSGNECKFREILETCTQKLLCRALPYAWFQSIFELHFHMYFAFSSRVSSSVSHRIDQNI